MANLLNGDRHDQPIDDRHSISQRQNAHDIPRAKIGPGAYESVHIYEHCADWRSRLTYRPGEANDGASTAGVGAYRAGVASGNTCTIFQEGAGMISGRRRTATRSAIRQPLAVRST